MAVQNLERIEEKIDKVVSGAIEIADGIGGIVFRNMVELMEVAKLMALSGPAVPTHLRGAPGTCLAICIQSVKWGFDPFSVANKSYLVNNRGEERLSYESQLVHAVIERHAPLKGRLRFTYEGEGDERICIVRGTPKDELEPLEFRSEPLGKLKPKLNSDGKLKGSPLWGTKPDLQLFYNASRDWCRTYYPDVLMGVYATDEGEDDHRGPDKAKDVTPKPAIAARLKGNKGAGFSAAHVADAIAEATVVAETADPETGEIKEVEAVAQPNMENEPRAQPADPAAARSDAIMDAEADGEAAFINRAKMTAVPARYGNDQGLIIAWQKGWKRARDRSEGLA